MAGRQHREAARLSSAFSPPGSRQTLDDSMTDQHQVHSIIATAIYDALKKDPDHRMDAEEAKQIAKCIVEALAGAGLQIAPLGKK
jgi:hypothetical protein